MSSPDVSTLVLEEVSKHFARGVGADCVSLDVDAGEVVGVWGRRRSGRSTLLRIAAGVERPDVGTVRIEGADVWGAREARRHVAVWHPLFPPDQGRTVERQVAISWRRGRRPVRDVRRAAADALDRVGAGDCGTRPPSDLDHAEIVRVALARALVMQPKVLVLDEPLSGLDAPTAERVMEVIARIAREDGIATLLTASEVSQLAGVDRHLSISHGVLRGRTAPALADVLRLRGA